MGQEPMTQRIRKLAEELLPLTDNPPARPTQQDRDRLMAVRRKIKRFPDEVVLTEAEEVDRLYLYVVATKEANRQEEFYEQNGDRWATL